MADIVAFVPGTYTPGAENALRNAVNVINAAWSQANLKTGAFEDKIAAITDAATGWLSTTAAPHITGGAAPAPTVLEPDVDIPSTQSATDVMSLFDSKYAELVALLSDKFVTFRTAYFPNEQASYAAVETWLSNALANPSGLPTAVSSQLLADDESRILKEASRATDAVLATFAARRFPMPPGAAASATLQIQQKAQDAIAESSRKITIGSIEQLRFVVTQTVAMRQAAMGAAIEYIKAIASAPDMASRLVGIGYDAQSKLISAASQFYNSRTAVAELKAKVDQFNVGTSLDAATKNQAADLTLIEDRLKALLTECQAFAQMATSLYNNLHASAGTGYSVNGT